GVKNNMAWLIAPEEAGYSPGGLGRSQHADLNCGYLHIGRQLLQGFRYYPAFNRLHALYAASGLDRQRCDACHPVTSLGCDRLDIGGHSRPGRWVMTGNRKNDRPQFGVAFSHALKIKT